MGKSPCRKWGADTRNGADAASEPGRQLAGEENEIPGAESILGEEFEVPVKCGGHPHDHVPRIRGPLVSLQMGSGFRCLVISKSLRRKPTTHNDGNGVDRRLPLRWTEIDRDEVPVIFERGLPTLARSQPATISRTTRTPITQQQKPDPDTQRPRHISRYDLRAAQDADG